MMDYLKSDEMLTCDDEALVFFRPLMDVYPNLEFTNIDATGVKQRRAVYIFPNDMIRHGNVFIEAWQKKDYFHFVLKKSIMTEAEKAESKRDWKKDNSSRGRVSVYMSYKKELFDYIVPKLNMIDSLK